MATSAPTPTTAELRHPARVAVVAAKWNVHIVDELLNGCVKRLRELGLDDDRLTIERVPGAFELPGAARMCVNTKRFDAVILIGCVIRGETYHFEVVANEAARGIQQVSVDSGIPCIFGVLTVDTEQQAKDRIGGAHGHAGRAAADAAAEMIGLAARLNAPAAGR